MPNEAYFGVEHFIHLGLMRDRETLLCPLEHSGEKVH